MVKDGEVVDTWRWPIDILQHNFFHNYFLVRYYFFMKFFRIGLSAGMTRVTLGPQCLQGSQVHLMHATWFGGKLQIYLGGQMVRGLRIYLANLKKEDFILC